MDPNTGHRVHLHNTALGKAILAHYPRERLEAILDRHGMPQTSEETIIDRGGLFEELADRALELAAKLAKGAPLAQKAVKNAMLVGQNDLEAGLQTESDAFGLLWTTQDTIEGIDAFHDGRTPEFEGK